MRELHITTDQSSASETEFSLMESVIWEHCCGFWLLPEHLQRLKSSSEFFSRSYDEDSLVAQLDKVTQGLTPETHVVHVEISPKGEIKLSSEPFIEDRSPVRADLAKKSIDVDNIFLYHNTTNRRVYEDAIAGMSSVDEVLLWNDKGEITESCTSNIIIEQNGQYITPPVSCGLLPGAYRANLLQEDRFIERPISIDEMRECDKVYLINSLVGWREISNWGRGQSGT